MLESESGLRVNAMFLGQVHPSLPRARLISVPCMRDEIDLIVADQIARGEDVSEAVPGADAPFVLPGETHRREPRCLHARMIHLCARARTSACVTIRLSVFSCARGSR